MFGKAATPFYYIIVLLQLTAISPWLIKHRKNWMYFITPMYLVLIYTYNIIIGSMPYLYETVFPAWFFFYILGMDCRSGKLDRLIEKVKGYWIVVALLLSICEAYILKAIGCADGFVVTQIKFSSFLYAATICLLLQKAKHHVEINVVTLIGDYSYGIFYCHILVLVFVRKMIQAFALDRVWLVHFGLCFVLTAIGSGIAICLARYILNKIKCEKIITLIGF